MDPKGAPFDFYGGGGKITLVLDFFLRAPESGFLFFVWYGLGFFSARIMCINNQKRLSIDSDQGMTTRLIKCLIL